MDESGSKISTKGLTYEAAGVSIHKAEEAIERIKNLAEKTRTAHVLDGIGPFGASFQASFGDMQEPILVATTDGVGTKVKLASTFKTYKNIGYDLVAVNVNDIITTGAYPLFFLDYISCHQVIPDVLIEIAEGITDGCLECNAALIGGEISEMRDVYLPGEFDLAGFMVGVVDKNDRITGNSINCGDVVLALASSGIHANGFTLVRRIFANLNVSEWNSYIPELGETLSEAVLRPTKMYIKELENLREFGLELKGIAHVSGGGICGNLSRILPAGAGATIRTSYIDTPPIFNYIRNQGQIDDDEMWRVFNMGVGMLIVLNQEQCEQALYCARENDFSLKIVGEIVEGNREVTLI